MHAACKVLLRAEDRSVHRSNLLRVQPYAALWNTSSDLSYASTIHRPTLIHHPWPLTYTKNHDNASKLPLTSRTLMDYNQRCSRCS